MGFLDSGKKYVTVRYLEVDYYCLHRLEVYGHAGKKHDIIEKRRVYI